MISVASIIKRFRAGEVLGASGPLVADQALSTQRSVVLLVDRFALKLRRPISGEMAPRSGDQSTTQLRRAIALQEVRLGRALSPKIYVGAATLTEADDGTLRLVTAPDVFGEVLVVMRRLAHADRADERLLRGELTLKHLRPLMAQLAEFHADSSAYGVTGSNGVVERVTRRFRTTGLPLIEDGRVTEAEMNSLLVDVEQHATTLEDLLDHRVRERRLRRIHGAIRLDHLYVGDSLGIIDPREWSDIEAVTDTAEELSLLWLQLHAAGASALADQCVNLYAGAAKDGTLARVLPLFARLTALREAVTETENARSRWYIDRAFRRTNERVVS